MAQKQRKKKRGPLKRLLLYIAIPLVVWFLAFVLWFFWQDMMRLVNRGRVTEKAKSTAPPPGSEASRPARPSRSDEKIREEDRRKLEDIIKRGQ